MKSIISFLSALILFFLCITPTFAQEIYTTEKLITVDISKQMLYAWEGGKVILETPVSTGLWQSPTVKGTFKINRKYLQDDMRGISPVHGSYFLPKVPDVMYFYKGYAIHGTYWHSNFGNRMSNGCVNVPLTVSRTLYEWAPEGTQVLIF